MGPLKREEYLSLGVIAGYIELIRSTMQSRSHSLMAFTPQNLSSALKAARKESSYTARFSIRALRRYEIESRLSQSSNSARWLREKTMPSKS